MFNILSLFQGGWPVFEKEGISKKQEITYKEKGSDTLGNCTLYNTRVL